MPDEGNVSLLFPVSRNLENRMLIHVACDWFGNRFRPQFAGATHITLRLISTARLAAQPEISSETGDCFTVVFRSLWSKMLSVESTGGPRFLRVRATLDQHLQHQLGSI